jgi:hypothetical protein
MINFHTNDINKGFVKSTVWNTLAHLKVYNIGNTTSGQKINPDMPSGVTGKFRIDLYLHDSRNIFKLRENSDRIQHEICHALLIGTPHFVSGVHDNINNRFTVNYWYWDRFKYTKFTLSIIDIRQYL